MKKVLFLLFVALCLVSCRTATVEDATELEIVVPIVEESTGIAATPVEEMGDATETTEVPAKPEGLESSIENEVSKADSEEVSSEEVSSEEVSHDAVAGDEVSSEELPDVLPQESVLEEESDLSDVSVAPEEEMPLDEDSSNATDESAVEYDTKEEMPSIPAIETKEEIPSSPAIETKEEPVGEAGRGETVPINTDDPVVVVAPPKANETPKIDEGSFLDRLIAFILREKLFCFGVFTVIVGMVMLIVVLIRDLVRSGRGCTASTGCEDSNEGQESGNEVSASPATKGDKKESLPLDDEDEFLRSLLNS